MVALHKSSHWFVSNGFELVGPFSLLLFVLGNNRRNDSGISFGICQQETKVPARRELLIDCQQFLNIMIDSRRCPFYFGLNENRVGADLLTKYVWLHDYSTSG
jgi:hypothetical protein